MLKPEDLFDLSGFEHKALFDDLEYVWDALKRIKPYIGEVIKPNVTQVRKKGGMLARTYVLYEGKVLAEGFELKPGDATNGTFVVIREGKELSGATVLYAGAVLFDSNISIGNGTVVEPGALIKGPAIIGANTEIRQGAYIRGNVIVGDGCVVGHTTEVKDSIMLNGAKAGHFAYIGDSILGRVNLGAGTKLANLKIKVSGPTVRVNISGKWYDTGLRKFGAILGDGVETGCNAVLNPGAILGKGTLVYANASLRGYYPPRSIVKLRQGQRVYKGGE